MSRKTELTPEEAAAFGRLLSHVGFAPTIKLGKGTDAKAIRRVTDANVVYALVEQTALGLRDGVQRYTLWLAPLRAHANGNGKRISNSQRAWSPAAREAQSKRMVQMWKRRRATTTTTA